MILVLLFPSDEAGIVSITFLAAYFPIMVSTRHAVRALPTIWEDSVRTLGGGRWAVLRQVVLPGILPGLFGGLSVGMGVAWICVISAEMISGRLGVGYRTWQAYTVLDYPGVFVGIITIGVLGFATASATSQLPGLSTAVEALRPRSVELSSDQTTAAVGTASGSYAVTASGGARLVDGRAGLVAPSLDGGGFVWSLVADDPSSLTAYSTDGTAHPVATSLPTGPRVTTFRVSRDGTRALLLLDNQGASRLLVAAVVRDSDGVPIRLGPPLELSAPDGSPVDATWADQLTVAVLTTVGESSRVTRPRSAATRRAPDARRARRWPSSAATDSSGCWS